MWLITPSFFVSVVAKDPAGQDRLCVRARTRGDLERLRTLYCPGLTKPEGGTGTDYEWRSYVDRTSWAKALGRMAFTLDYRNMKDRVANDRRHNILLEVWHVLKALNPRAGRATGHRFYPPFPYDETEPF